MFIRVLTAVLLLIGTASPLVAQEPANPRHDEFKKQLLEKIRTKLRTEHRRILSRVEGMLDRELAGAEAAPERPSRPGKPDQTKGTDWDKKIAEIKKQQRKLDLQKDELDSQIRKIERFKEDEALAKEARESGPHDGPEVQEFFDECMTSHEAKDFTKSIAGFKKIFYNFTKTNIGYTSAYNIACGYALSGDADRAIDWLEISIEFGFTKFDHIREDADLESLRDHVRYKKLLADK